jgi:hypothetical protein
MGAELADMVNRERQAHPSCAASDERVAMIEMFQEFVKDSLYVHTDSFEENRELHRDPIGMRRSTASIATIGNRLRAE